MWAFEQTSRPCCLFSIFCYTMAAVVPDVLFYLFSLVIGPLVFLYQVIMATMMSLPLKFLKMIATSKNIKSRFVVLALIIQNWILECSTQTVVRWTTKLLLHGAIYWPAVANLEIWPLALLQVLREKKTVLVLQDLIQDILDPNGQLRPTSNKKIRGAFEHAFIKDF